MTHWVIRQGFMLTNPRGEVVAEGGESIAVDHPAVVACPDMTSLAYLVRDEAKAAAPVAPTKPAPLVRPLTGLDALDSDPGDEADED